VTATGRLVMAAERVDADPPQIAYITDDGVHRSGVVEGKACPLLAVHLLAGLVSLIHPHGKLASRSAIDKHMAAARRLVSFASDRGFTGGAPQLGRGALVEFWLVCQHMDELGSRAMLKAWDEETRGLHPQVRELLGGRTFKRGRQRHEPLSPYTEAEWARLLTTCRTHVHEAFTAHKTALEQAKLGEDPVTTGAWTDTNLSWLLAGTGPVAARHLRSLGARQETVKVVRPDWHRVREALFPRPRVVISYQLLFGAYSGIVPDGIDGLGLRDIEWAGDAQILLSYVKGRTAQESLNLPRNAVRLLERWLEHSALLRSFAAAEDREVLWLRDTSVRIENSKVSNISVRAWVRHHGLLDDAGEPLPINRQRIRTTFHSHRDRRAWSGSGRATIDPNHSPAVEGDNYLTASTPAQRNAIDSIIEDAQADLLRRARPPTVLTRADAVSLARDYPQTLARLQLNDAVIAELVGGKRDVFVAACADQLSGLHGPKGRPCPARPWVCLLCPLAIFTPRHATNLLRLKAFLRPAMAPDALRPVHGGVRPLRATDHRDPRPLRCRGPGGGGEPGRRHRRRTAAARRGANRVTHDVGFQGLPQLSPFAGADIAESAGWTILPSFVRPRFDNDAWDLRGVQGRPAHLPTCELVWDFTTIINPRWRLPVKELMFAYLVPRHPRVSQLAYAYRTPRAVATCAGRRHAVIEWLNWLTRQGVTSLRQVTQHNCDRYLAIRSNVHDKHGRLLRETSVTHKRSVVAAIMDLATYGEIFTSDSYAPDLRPWNRMRPAVVAGYKPTGENKTPPIPDARLQPLLAACLYIVEVLGSHVAELNERVREVPRRSGWTAGMRPRPTTAHMAQALQQHLDSGEPLPELVANQVQLRLKAGWDPADPLLQVSFQPLAERVGCREFRKTRLDDELRRLTEQTLTVVGVARPWSRDAEAVARADDAELVPWTAPLHTREVFDLVEVASNASLTVIAGLSGMRDCELSELVVGCRRSTEIAPGLIRYRIASKLIKGQPLGGLADEWVVVEQVHRAVALAERLRRGEEGTLLFGQIKFHARYTRSLRQWINGPAGRRLGLAPIPEGPVNVRMLRRTFAMELAHRPGGLLAAKTHLRHLSAVTSEGYAARPGGAQAKLLEEINEEEQERNLSLILAEFRNYQQGILPSGPGARDLTDFFSHVDRQITTEQASAPQIRHGDQDIRNLLAKRASTLHLGTANYCWFTDPGKALCLKLAGTPTADKPLAGMCDSARCRQATHHPCHRPVWQDTVNTNRTFIGTLGRTQKTERVRLQAELDRAQRVLDDLDAAAHEGKHADAHH